MAAAQGKTNWFAIWISAAVVAVLVIGTVLVVTLNNAASGPGAAPEGDSITESGAIVVGDGPDQVYLWFDFACPHCQQFEGIYGPEIEQLVADGAITLHLQPVALSTLNAASGTDFSARSASALYCVAQAEPSAALPFMTTVMNAQASGAGFTDEQLIAYAEGVGVSDASECITDAPYKKFALAQAAELPKDASGSAGTPTLVVNGERIDITGSVEADITDRIG